MVFLAQRVVEVRGKSGLIAFHARCREELFAVRLQLQHERCTERLGVLTGPNVDVHAILNVSSSTLPSFIGA